MAKPVLGALPANPAASAPGDAASAGASGDNAALATHRHAREGFGAVTAAANHGNTAATGSASTIPHSDHDHGTPPVIAAAALIYAFDTVR